MALDKVADGNHGELLLRWILIQFKKVSLLLILKLTCIQALLALKMLYFTHVAARKRVVAYLAVGICLDLCTFQLNCNMCSNFTSKS